MPNDILAACSKIPNSMRHPPCPPNYRFTGYERDETGLDYAFARYYSPRLGRFLSTDPLGGAISDLQSHNAYSYVLNNAMNLTDPTGMVCSGNVGETRDTPCNPANSGGGGGSGSFAGYGDLGLTLIPIMGEVEVSISITLPFP